MDIQIRVESAEELDCDLTSALARVAFQKNGAELSSPRFAWTYREGYERPIIISAYANAAKVGQLACFIKTFGLAQRMRKAAELVDLFVSPEVRGFKIASRLYQEMHKILLGENIDIMFAYANEGASVLNRRFFAMEEVTQLPVRMGLSLLPASLGSPDGIKLIEDHREIAVACVSCAGTGSQGGVQLNRSELQARIGSPIHRYLCATDGNTAIIASPRVIRSVPLLLVCATFSTTRARKKDTGAMIAKLSRAAGRRVFLYAGWNDALALENGYPLPERVLRGKFLIQSNCLNSRRDSIGRFELLDVDYG